MKASNPSETTFPKTTSFNNELKNLSAFDFLKVLKQNMSDAYCITDEGGCIVDVNKKYCHALGYQESELLEQSFSNLLPPEIRPYALMLHHEYIWGQSDENAAEWSYLAKSGNEIIFRSNTSRLFVSDAKRYKLEILLPAPEKPSEPENVIKKTHHQFKNTLHEISGLLQLQSAQLQGEARTAVLFSQKRITAIAFAFELLYKSNQSEEIDLAEYVSGLAAKYQHDYEIQVEHGTLYWQVDKAYALGIILTEFLNSREEQTSTNQKILIKGKITDSCYFLTISADELMNTALSKFSDQLINALGKQLQAQINIQNHSKEAFKLECRL